MDDPFASDSAVLADFLHRERNDPGFLQRRRASGRFGAGQSIVEQAVERGRSNSTIWFHPPPLIRLSKISIGLWTLVVLFALFGLVFVGELSVMQQQQQNDGGGGGVDGLQQLAAMMQQMMQAQQQQQAQIAELGQAVQGAGAAVGATQTITETVVNDIVQQVQGAFAQQQQAQQDQVQQLIAAQQTQQQNMDQIGQVIQGLQTQQQQNVDQIGQAVQGLHQQLNQAQQQQQQPAGGAGGTVNGPTGVTATGSGSVGGGIPQTFAMGAGPTRTGSPTISPAVAYAMQQGVIPVDAKGLGKPLAYDPSKPDKTPSFQDWSDSIITTIDAQMPGLYEVLEWMVQTQPKSVINKDDVKLRFPQLDPLLVEYSEHNLYAVLTTYTGGEARNLVRQAKRPNGYEAWRLLQVRFNPVTVGRQRAHLSKITSPTENIPLEKLGSEVSHCLGEQDFRL